MDLETCFGIKIKSEERHREEELRDADQLDGRVQVDETRLFETKKPLPFLMFSLLRDEELQVDGGPVEGLVVLVEDFDVNNAPLIDAMVDGNMWVGKGEVVGDVHDPEAGGHCHVRVAGAADVSADNLEILEENGRVADFAGDNISGREDILGFFEA